MSEVGQLVAIRSHSSEGIRQLSHGGGIRVVDSHIRIGTSSVVTCAGVGIELDAPRPAVVRHSFVRGRNVGLSVHNSGGIDLAKLSRNDLHDNQQAVQADDVAVAQTLAQANVVTTDSNSSQQPYERYGTPNLDSEVDEADTPLA